ncbi:MAG: mannose-1-phosphate guanylyltransferase [Eubacteriales bacterium]|nr:mannose-1-phosphate guanylyltransferase [Eubacteriales bacterium]
MLKIAVIMAGGQGERFWPLSRNGFPKQFISIFEGCDTLIQQTYHRIRPVVDDVYVVTNAAYTEIVAKQLPTLPRENILAEPYARNTAPCIGLAAAVIRKRCGDAVIVALPSDHLVREEALFRQLIGKGAALAQQTKQIVTYGITPDHAETGYGYIQYGDGVGDMVFKVLRFIEKPNLSTAQQFLSTGGYLWNSGIFLYPAETMLKRIGFHLPAMGESFQRIGYAVGSPGYETVLEQEYRDLQSVSIDFGVMEKEKDILTIPCDFGWDDVGNWNAVKRLRASDGKGNVISGDVALLDAKNCLVQGGKRLIAVVGIHDAVIIDTDDALLVCASDATQSIKALLADLKEQHRADIL